jgi:hypothetical protein
MIYELEAPVGNHQRVDRKAQSPEQISSRADPQSSEKVFSEISRRLPKKRTGMKHSAATKTASSRRLTVPPRQAGALVVGGDHIGLGIARSLGQRGVPVCILDDQLSVSSFSRYTKRFIQVKDLRDERTAIEPVLEAGHRFGLRNWVLFPTRDETVVAFSRHRAELCRILQSADSGLGYRCQ